MRDRAGFTVVELLLAAMVGVVILGAAFQTLIVQEQTFRAQRSVSATRNAERTALDVLSTELREVSADAGGRSGGDIRRMGSDSIEFRVFRKVGLVCDRSAGTLELYGIGDRLTAGDSVLIFAEGDPGSGADDGWVAARALTVASTGTCPALTGYAPLTLRLGSAVAGLSAIRAGAPVRGFDWVTYGVYRDPAGDYVLGRHSEGGAVQRVIGPLAAPAAGGLRLTYYDANGATTADPTRVARIVISVKARARSGAAVHRRRADSLVTQIYLRNN